MHAFLSVGTRQKLVVGFVTSSVGGQMIQSLEALKFLNLGTAPVI